MNAPTRTLLLCTALIGAAGMAQAQATGLTRADIEAAYAEFERIEIAFGPTQVKVEAIDAQTGQVVEAIYDRATGAILKQETGTVAGTVGSGTEVKSRADDFVRVRASDDPAATGQGRAFDDNPKGDDDDGIDDTTGGDDSDDDSPRASAQSNAGGTSNDDRGRGRGRSGSGGSDDDGSDDRGGDRSGKGGSDDDQSDGDDD
jgi:hypothetical protein